MNTFLVLAAVMAAIAAAAVAMPLLRDKQTRMFGGLVAMIVIGAAAGLYPLWSNWDWHAPASRPGPAGPDVAAMVAKLEGRLRSQPNDVNGWLLLGRSYLALEKLDDAVAAYGHAHQLDSKNADAAIGLGEAMSLRAGGEITRPAAEMFEEGLALEPGNPQALLYGGFAAAVRGDRTVARSRWEALKALHPPPQIVAMLDARIAELDAAAAPAAGTDSSTTGTSPSSGDFGPAQVTVNISIAPALKQRFKPEAALFVFAREPGSRGPPLAVKRLAAAAIGTTVQLTPADSMLPARALVSGKTVSVTARVSLKGQPIPEAGDLYGELSYEVGRDGIRNLVIDRVAE